MFSFCFSDVFFNFSYVSLFLFFFLNFSFSDFLFFCFVLRFYDFSDFYVCFSDLDGFAHVSDVF